MGNISSHSLITRHVGAGLQRYLTTEDLPFIALGNFLTDVSQFRDPTAQIGAKIKIYRVALDNTKLPWLFPDLQLSYADVCEWIDALLGVGTATQPHGALSEYFFHLMHAFTLLSAQQTGISENEANRLFDIRFTQYYPHEHLDFPPATLASFQSGDRFKPSPRSMVGYLEEQVQYISESLSHLEQQWKLASSPRQSDELRHDCLADLGHISHAIEDYFFHSNFCELLYFQLLWQVHQTSRSSPDEELPDFWSEWFDENALHGRREGGSVRLRRRFYRRLRYPQRHGSTNPEHHGQGSSSPRRSIDATHLIYTGGFGASDLYHTLYEALDGIETYAQRWGFAQVWSGLVLLENVLEEDNRRRMVRSDERIKHVTEQHRAQLQSVEYETRIDEKVSAGKISESVGDALKRAIATDRRVSQEFPKTPGLGGFLILLATEVQKQADISASRSNELDNLRRIQEGGTDIRCSGEEIGSHSLLAKDTSNSGPFRGEAIALAFHASVNVALRLLLEVQARSEHRTGLWWDGIVRHYLRFPRTTSGSWEYEVFRRQQQIGPDYNAPLDYTLGDPPPISRLSGATVARAQSRPTMTRLQLEYQQLAARYERDFARYLESR